MPSFEAHPLHVFVGNRFIEVGDVNDVICGALVEIHCELHHYHIHADNRDSYNGIIQQILVLQPGKPRALNAYKRKNVREGPILLNPTLRIDGNSDNVSDDRTPHVSLSRTHIFSVDNCDAGGSSSPAIAAEANIGNHGTMFSPPVTLTTPLIEMPNDTRDEQVSAQNTNNNTNVGSVAVTGASPTFDNYHCWVHIDNRSQQLTKGWTVATKIRAKPWTAQREERSATDFMFLNTDCEISVKLCPHFLSFPCF